MNVLKTRNEQVKFVDNKISEHIKNNNLKIISINDLCGLISEEDVEDLFLYYDDDLSDIILRVVIDGNYTIIEVKSIVSESIYRNKFIIAKEVTEISIDNIRIDVQN